jgi:hypothetical protein
VLLLAIRHVSADRLDELRDASHRESRRNSKRRNRAA